MDNAPIHTSKSLKEKIPQWRQKKLERFWLPTYSPHLNLIEIEAYSSWQHLVEYGLKILEGFAIN